MSIQNSRHSGSTPPLTPNALLSNSCSRMTLTSQILALDVGTRRIGVARADSVSRIAFPLTTIDVDGDELKKISQLITENDPMVLVVGYPRNQSGEPTAQTTITEAF